MKTSSLRITEVTRYNLTEGYSDTEEGSGGVRTLGEFNSQEQAERIARALMKSAPDSTFEPLRGAPEYSPVLQYVIVERGFDIGAMAFYAYYQEEAEQHREQLEKHFQRDFRVFGREVTDPVALARRGMEVRPTSWAPLDL